VNPYNPLNHDKVCGASEKRATGTFVCISATHPGNKHYMVKEKTS